MTNNKYRTLVLFNCIAFLGFISFCFVVGANKPEKIVPPTAISSTADMVTLISQARVKQKLEPLTENKILDETARIKACDMRDRVYFNHQNPEGEFSWGNIQYYGYNYEYVGENLATGYTYGQQVFDAWMNSPSHKEEMLSSLYNEVGIGRCGAYTVAHFGRSK